MPVPAKVCKDPLCCSLLLSNFAIGISKNLVIQPKIKRVYKISLIHSLHYRYQAVLIQ